MIPGFGFNSFSDVFSSVVHNNSHLLCCFAEYAYGPSARPQLTCRRGNIEL
jgi:hypothetical protein